MIYRHAVLGNLVATLLSTTAWAQIPAGSLPQSQGTVGGQNQPSSIPDNAPVPSGSVSPQAPGTAPESQGLEDIVVTAQKRSESLQDVPIAISAVTATQLSNTGINNVSDIKLVVPALNVTNSAGSVSFSLRGIGSNGIGPGVENPIALYIDGVYYASPAASLLALNNVAQIEVLKGPQGTLFGRNATGGLLQITTREPSEVATGSANVSYGNYDIFNGDAYISGPITDTLFADFAVTGTHQGDGYGRNLATGGDVLKIDRDIALRSKMVFAPRDGTKFTLIGDYATHRDSFITNVVRGGTVSGYFPAAGPVPDLGYDAFNDTAPVTTTKGGGVSLRYDQEINDLNFMSLTAYRKSKQSTLFDYDGTQQPLEYISQTQGDHQFSQELQLSSRQRGRFTWLVGAYYFKGVSAYDPFILTANDQGVRVTINNSVSAESFAGYAQGTYEIFDDTNLTLGGRYTTEKRSAYDGLTDVFVLPLNLALPTTEAPDASKRFNKFTYRASLDHRFSPEVLAYLSYNRGFKSGGFNAPLPGSAAYRPETLDAFEGGLKLDIVDRRVRLNVAGFYYRYTDIQIQQLLAGAITILNAGKARDYGIDADVTVKATDSLRLNGGFNLISAKFTSFPNCLRSTPAGGTPSVVGSCAGNQLPLAATFTMNAGASYNRDLGFAIFDGAINLYHSSGFYTESDNITRQRAYDILNGTLKLTLPNKISFGVFGKNLLNKRVLNFASTLPNGSHFVNYQAPRTYGATVGFSF
ncbi:TonB-dependent receptor [Sphingobium lactosutens]|uniref:TonB-denpendent receptor n=1 Tax=Sphingobium lactosutens DS20 TaxID=1331060 RepID=T0INM5_9SPHN|nr:TonB-dependent receptor [Sphingobium lactosutens]EQB13390.1 hypothetical protein RLDS_16790 [Sphingobium lactosutens DS20]